MATLPLCPGSDCDGESGLIECRSQVIHGVNSNAAPGPWHGLDESYLKHLLAGIRVYLDDLSVWVECPEIRDFGFKLTDTSLGVFDAVPGTL